METAPTGWMEAKGVGYGALSALNSRLIYTAVTPYGQTGPRAHYKGADLSGQAMGGVVNGQRQEVGEFRMPGAAFEMSGTRGNFGAAHHFWASTTRRPSGKSAWEPPNSSPSAKKGSSNARAKGVDVRIRPHGHSRVGPDLGVRGICVDEDAGRPRSRGHQRLNRLVRWILNAALGHGSRASTRPRMRVALSVPE